MNRRKEYKPIFRVPPGFKGDKEVLLKAALDQFFEYIRASNQSVPHSFSVIDGHKVIVFTFDSCKSSEDGDVLIIRPVYTSRYAKW